MGLIASVRKSIRLRALSKVLGAPIAKHDLRAMFEGAPRRDAALERLLDMVLADRDLRQVVARHEADRDTLRSVYKTLLRCYAGWWRRGHWVPASSLAFGRPLDYALSGLAGDREDDYNTAFEVAFALVSYFENGKIGALPPLSTPPRAPLQTTSVLHRPAIARPDETNESPRDRVAPTKQHDGRIGTYKGRVPSPQAPTQVQPSLAPLYSIPDELPSSAFLTVWQAALNHIGSMVQDGVQTWLKGAPSPPIFEHLSFRLGNQLFFVRIEDVAGQIVGPGSRTGLLRVADRFGGWPCLMPMALGHDGHWRTALPGWGLRHARTGQPVDPLALVSDEEIEMTDWETHQFGVQVVVQQLEAAGFTIGAHQGYLDVDPSIWIDGDNGPEWVVVRVARYPKQRADIPPHWGSIVKRCRGRSVRGHFASVSVARADARFAPGDPSPGRLLRGHGMYVRYTGLEEVAVRSKMEAEGRKDGNAPRCEQ